MLIALSTFSCKAQDLQIGNAYSFSFDGVREEIVFKKNNTFICTKSYPNTTTKVVYGKWKIENDLVVLDTYVGKDAPKYFCNKEYNSTFKDSIVSIDLIYNTDSSKFDGSVLVESDTNTVQFLLVDKKFTINRDTSVTNLVLSGDHASLVNLDVNFRKYNSYQCFITPDRYPYFENSHFKVEENKIISETNKKDYYVLKR